MLRIAFAVFMILHGLVHLLGFVKAFEIADINQLTQSISKPKGVVWLLVALLMASSTALFLLKKDLWWPIALIAIVLSQLLILFQWQDARFGTIANVAILLVCLSGFGSWKFDRMVRSELKSFLPGNAGLSQMTTEHSISHLPETVQLWLRNSKVIGKSQISTVRLTQSGRMKIKPNGAWMKVNAEQWFTIDEPGFIWNADVGNGSFIQFSGRDKFVKGKGSMLIKLFSLIPVVNAKGTSIDQGVMVRYLAEIIWFPTAALSEYIVWEELSPTKAKAIFTYGNLSVDGIFTFNDQGQPLSFEAKRFYDQTGALEIWRIDIDEAHLKTLHKMTVPAKASVTWKLKEGDFTWYEVEVSE